MRWLWARACLLTRRRTGRVAGGAQAAALQQKLDQLQETTEELLRERQTSEGRLVAGEALALLLMCWGIRVRYLGFWIWDFKGLEGLIIYPCTRDQCMMHPCNPAIRI